MKKACEAEGAKLYCPSPVYCTDNAAMIGVAAYHKYIAKDFSDLTLNAIPNLSL